MTHKIIKTDNYLLVVDDSEIKAGDWIKWSDSIFKASTDTEYLPPTKKIISHLPLNGSPILCGVDLLPPIEDDVDKLATNYVTEDGKHGLHDDADRELLSFKAGYSKAREKYKYTEEDIRKALLIKHDGLDADYVIEVISNKYPTEFECETVTIPSYKDKMGNIRTEKTLIKTTTNAQGQQVWVGKYK